MSDPVPAVVDCRHVLPEPSWWRREARCVRCDKPFKKVRRMRLIGVMDTAAPYVYEQFWSEWEPV